MYVHVMTINTIRIVDDRFLYFVWDHHVESRESHSFLDRLFETKKGFLKNEICECQFFNCYTDHLESEDSIIFGKCEHSLFR